MKKMIIILLILPIISFSQNFGFGQIETKKTYYEHGQVLSEINYKDRKREGLCRYYYQNGTLMSESNYKNGKLIGASKSYYKNGQLESHGTYKYTESGVYSRKDGVWKYYYDNGQLQTESIIKDGIEKLKFYDKDGKLLPMDGDC